MTFLVIIDFRCVCTKRIQTDIPLPPPRKRKRVRTNPGLLTRFLVHPELKNTLSVIARSASYQLIMHALRSALAMWHTGMGLLRKEVTVWFGTDPGSAGLPYCPIRSHFSSSQGQMCLHCS